MNNGFFFSFRGMCQAPFLS